MSPLFRPDGLPANDPVFNPETVLVGENVLVPAMVSFPVRPTYGAVPVIAA